MIGWPTFWCTPTGVEFYHLGMECHDCDTSWEVPCTLEEREEEDWEAQGGVPCAGCASLNTRVRSKGGRSQYVRPDTGELMVSPLPVGAVYAAEGWGHGPQNWRTKRADGRDQYVTRVNEVDGRVLVCVCPDGHPWTIDARASNCTMPDDDEHWCWVRHGSAEAGTLHVDKNGVTCAAGAGSIATGKWHGFLHGGQLVTC